MGEAGEFFGDTLVERATSWREEEDEGWSGERVSDLMGLAEGLDGGEEGFALDDHPLASAVRSVIGGAMFVGGPVAKIMRLESENASLLGFAEDAFAERCGGDIGEERNDVDVHSGKCGEF